jgi:hypothetical protein
MRFLRLTVPLLALGLGACSSSGEGGSIAVTWRFDGSSCTNAGVEQVRIAIAGETLNPDTFDCASGVVSFNNFFNGTYAVVVQGLNAITGEALWSGTATAVVNNGDTAVTVTLEPLSPDNTVAYLSWGFDPATGQVPQCGVGQRLDSVGIFIDNQDSNLVYNCGDGLNPKLAATPYLPAGDHTLQLVAFNSTDNQIAFAETDPVTVTFAPGQAPNEILTFHWNVGGLRVTYAPYSSVSNYPNSPLPCPSGITDVDVFLDVPGDPNNPSNQSFPGWTCSSGATIDNAFPGTWAPFVSAFGGQTLLFFQDENSFPQQVTVTQARFFDPTDSSTQVFVPIFP